MAADLKIKEIFKDYEEVNLNRKGFSITFKDSASAIEAFKALTAELAKIDKEKGDGVLGVE